MTTQENDLRKTLINIENYHRKIHGLAKILLSLQYTTAQSPYNKFYDKELHDRVLQLVAFFNRKYSGVPSCKSDSDKVSEVPIFSNRSS